MENELFIATKNLYWIVFVKILIIEKRNIIVLIYTYNLLFKLCYDNGKKMQYMKTTFGLPHKYKLTHEIWDKMNDKNNCGFIFGLKKYVVYTLVNVVFFIILFL